MDKECHTEIIILEEKGAIDVNKCQNPEIIIKNHTFEGIGLNRVCSKCGLILSVREIK